MQIGPEQLSSALQFSAFLLVIFVSLEEFLTLLCVFSFYL